MLERSDAYQAAITGDHRRILLKAVIDIISPDIEFGGVESNSMSGYSDTARLRDKDFSQFSRRATLERNRWLLGGGFGLFPTQVAPLDIPFLSEAVSDSEGIFSTPVTVSQVFSGVSILQACSVYFSTDEADGVPEDFRVEVIQGGTVYHTETFTGNREDHVSIDGFTVHNPDAIRVVVTKISLPFRRVRAIEIVPGVYESWDNRIIAGFDVKQQANFSCLAMPYGTCTLSMDNLDRRFEPRNKEGIFRSIEDRQGIDVSIGVRLEDGSAEYKRVGIFYQFSGGWKTGDNGLTMTWNLVDIVGLLANRTFIVPDTLPTTLAGWFAACVAQLGDSFAERYHVDPDYADLPVTANSADDLANVTCGSVLRWACMVTSTWPRADAETGYLTAEPFWNQGNKLTLDNLADYPVIRANDELAALIFTLADGDNTKYVVSGNSTAASETKTVNNPFIHTTAEALTAARMILSTYGGNKLETTGRADPSSEIGDVDTVWLNESTATTARRQYQDFVIRSGVMLGCRSVLLQADGSFLFEERIVIAQSGNWTAPSGVTQLRIILVGRGEEGTAGTDGTWGSTGTDGVDGRGGMIWAGTIDINEDQTFDVSISDTATVFGAYSSANGQRYPLGYTDIASGDSYGRSGVKAPLPGSGDGGKGGKGGGQGYKRTVTVIEDTWLGSLPTTKEVIDKRPSKGTAGKAGATGCVVIYWDK